MIYEYKPLPINSMSDLLIKNLEVMRTKCSSFDLYTATVKDSTSLSEGRIPLTQEEIDLKKQEDRNEVINYLTTMLKKKENRDYIIIANNRISICEKIQNKNTDGQWCRYCLRNKKEAQCDGFEI